MAADHQPPSSDYLLITCPNYGGMFLSHGGAAYKVHDLAATGLSIGQDSIVWGEQMDMTALSEFGGSTIHTVTPFDDYATRLSPDPLDLHDVLRTEQGYAVVLTETNEVVELSSGMAATARWKLEGENDSCHVNSIQQYQGRLIASAFGMFTKHWEYKGQTQGRGVVFDVRTREVLITDLAQPHSLTVVDEDLYLCSSENGEVRQYSGWDLIRTICVDGYARGLALTTSLIYVGISRSRNIADSESAHSTARIAVLDRATGHRLATIPIPAKEIYDIRILTDGQVAKFAPALFAHGRAQLLTKIQETEERFRDHGWLKSEVERLHSANAILSEENSRLRSDAASLKADIPGDNQDLRNELEILQGELSSVKEHNRQLAESREAILRSKTHRIGRAILWPFSFLRNRKG